MSVAALYGKLNETAGLLGFGPDDFWPGEYLLGGLIFEWEDRELYLDWYLATHYSNYVEGN